MPMIIGEIRRYLRDNSTLHVSRTLKDIAYKALRLRENETNKELTNQEIAAILNIDVKLVDEAIKSVCEPFSLYDPIYSETGETAIILDQISDAKNNEFKWLEDIALLEAIKQLEQREKKVINLRYYQGKTQTQVANEIGISQAQVSRIEKNALDSIRSGFEFQ